MMKKKLMTLLLGLALCVGTVSFADGVSQEEFDALLKQNEELKTRIEVQEVKDMVIDELPIFYENKIPNISKGKMVKISYTGDVVDGVPTGKGMLEIKFNFTDEEMRTQDCVAVFDGVFSEFVLNGKGYSEITYTIDGEFERKYEEIGSFHYGIMNGRCTETEMWIRDGDNPFIVTYEYIGNYDYGFKNGLFEINNPIYMVKGQKAGSSWHQSGEFVNNIKTGLWRTKSVRMDGNESFREGNYRDGVKSGQWTYRNSDGEVEIEDYGHPDDSITIK